MMCANVGTIAMANTIIMIRQGREGLIKDPILTFDSTHRRISRVRTTYIYRPKQSWFQMTE